MRRTLALTTVLLAACALPGVALAQQTNGAGLRYLSWPGKAAATTRAAPTVAPAVAAAETPAPIPVRASAPVPLARIATAPVPAPSSRGLTPASAWLGSPRPAAPSPEPLPAPQPAFIEPAAPAPEPVPAPPPAQIAEIAPQPVAPAQTPAQAPAQTPAPAPAPQPVEAAAVDPMAPRRDAPIFRLQRPDGSVAAPPQAGAASSARYYSVHRQAGHEPDDIRMPAPVYLDALPVQLAQTPTSTDLAQPDGPPTLLRGADGKVRALPQTEADELP